MKKQAVKETLQCMECGKLFKRVIPKSLEVKCPKCGSYDTDLCSWGENPKASGLSHTKRY